ncbi:hypothetical protein CROQUDRAFT_517911 [Cronartium quercuum f. sp. fusiforme G11]|uniref:Secreted protein n=1 Tax=Cronartium quercuum f. sp. fusiforme G11 TaxID=708437 RepID=A0A9P6NN14_9BASI|nr:hypothetical protein CROQUDRAFT_517911 [Cronartium quercuum f. sp. fusiforme G11]
MLALITIALLSSTLWSSTLAATTKDRLPVYTYRCGTGWNMMETGYPGIKSCQDAIGAHYKCQVDTCGIGQVGQPGNKKGLEIVFKDCHKYLGGLGTSEVESGIAVDVEAKSYTVDWMKAYADVTGLPRRNNKTDNSEGPSNWKCHVKYGTIAGLPVCGQCTYDRDPKPPPEPQKCGLRWNTVPMKDSSIKSKYTKAKM